MNGRQKAFLAVLVAALVAAGAIALWPAPTKPAAAPPPPTTSPPPTPAPSPSKTYPYPFYPPGTCLTVPWLSDVTTTAVVPCDQPHDSETISVVVLPEGLTTDGTIIQATLGLCKEQYTAVRQRQEGKTPYYNSPLSPGAQYYQQGYRDASCAVTVSNQNDSRKMTAPLR
ncbi:septum formation family protein [Kitasatospora cineracea]|uniref:septum formation family protein n=1 Tax=Kitasatospora cineracea TaxID=88074 RepID=UPI00340F743B